MNLKELEYLVAIDEERHFNRAAERCFVSQPTLSGQLKKLEGELGLLLVDRSNRQVSMTDAGKEITLQAREVLIGIKKIKEISQCFHDPLAGEMHVGLIPTVAPYLLPAVMPLMKNDFPNLKLWLHEYQTKVLLTKLRDAELDVLILALPVETEEFEEYDLFSEPFWLAMPRSDPMAKMKQVELSDLNHHEMLLLEEGHCLRGQALDVCFMAGASEHQGFHATSLETLRHMVGEGMGMTLLPELAVPTTRRKTDSVQYRPFKTPPPARRIGMLYRQKSYRIEAYRKMARVIAARLTRK